VCQDTTRYLITYMGCFHCPTAGPPDQSAASIPISSIVWCNIVAATNSPAADQARLAT
jgi:hypothetical protein